MTPSSTLGLTEGSYEAYCLDQAVWHFGTALSGELEKAGQKRSKGEGKIIAARTSVLDKFLGSAGSSKKQQFADPAAFFD